MRESARLAYADGSRQLLSISLGSETIEVGISPPIQQENGNPRAFWVNAGDGLKAVLTSKLEPKRCRDAFLDMHSRNPLDRAV